MTGVQTCALPISLGTIGMAPALLLVHPGVSYRNVADLIADIKASKELFQVATPGISTVNHLAAVLFAQQAGVKLEYIPYKGSQPLITDLMAGHVKIGFNPIPVSRAAIEGTTLRLQVAARQERARRCPSLPAPLAPGLAAGKSAARRAESQNAAAEPRRAARARILVVRHLEELLWNLREEPGRDGVAVAPAAPKRVAQRETSLQIGRAHV